MANYCNLCLRAHENNLIKLLLIFALIIPGIGLAQAQDTPEASQDEEIIVTGIRAGLEAAADLKRNDARIMDAVVAEDIGKLPDNNIAEALQRVTGVSINREFGVGSEVSIRGLKQNRVELNGRTTLGEGRNGIDFQDFPASLLSVVEVIKSPTPEMIEGALGGTINLKTARPLDLDEPLTFVSLEAEYADKADNWAPVVNAHFGNNWDLDGGGAFGVMGMISYQDRTLRRDTFETSLFVFDNIDINLDGVVDAADAARNTPSGKYVVPTEHKFEPFIEDRERTAYNLTLQWSPDVEKGNFYIDLNTTERDGAQEAYSILHVLGDPVATSSSYEDSNGALNNYRMEGNVLAIPKSWSEFRVTDSFSHAIGGEWSFTEDLKVSAEYAISESDSESPRSEFNWRAVDPVAEASSPADANQWYTEVTLRNSQTQAPSVVYDDGEIYTMTEVFAFREFRHTTEDIDNTEDALRLDLEYAEPFGLAWVSALKAGFRSTQRDYERSQAEVRVKDIYKDMFDSDMLDANNNPVGSPDIIWMNDIATACPGCIITPDVSSDAFEHAGIAGTNHLTTFTVYDAERLQDTEATFELVQRLLAGSNYNNPKNKDGYINPNGGLEDSLREITSAYAMIEEDTEAFYAQAELQFESVSMVFGGRHVETKITSTAYNQEGTQLVSDTNEYSDFLPSFNATVDLTDETLMRFSAAKVMRRPDFGELSPAYIYNSDRVTAERGNPALDPYRATQFDLAIEHYYGQGNLISATLFYKDVESFLKSSSFCAYDAAALMAQNKSIPEQICIRPTATGNSDTYSFVSNAAELAAVDDRRGILTTTVDNGSNGTVQGFELGYHQALDFLPGIWSGLGLSANYTYSDSEDPDGVPLEDISEHSYNVQLYWEYKNFGVRFAYTWRDKFLDDNYQKRVERVGEQVTGDRNGDDPTLGNSYRDDLSQLDVAANWDINDQFSVVASITNLLADTTANQSVTGTTWQVRETDRRFNLGVRMQF